METIGKPVTVEGRASCSPGFSLRLVLVTLAATVQVANSDKLSESALHYYYPKLLIGSL